MKTTLPERSLIIKEKLDEITKEILAIAEDKIAMIILFGSYARGDWVQDVYREEHIIYSYQSDLNILLVLRTRRQSANSTRIIHEIEQRLKGKGIKLLPTPVTIEGVREFIKKPRVTFIADSIAEINKQLEKGHYFFSDIKKEGILLYDNGEFQLSEAKTLSWEERREIAKEDYEHWFESGTGFLTHASYALEKDDLKKAAFFLHQSVESFYNTILLVFSGYKPKLHDIAKLGSIANIYNAGLISIFPLASPEEQKAFELLREAYIDARYNKDYRISKDQILYLIERVERLKKFAVSTLI